MKQQGVIFEKTDNEKKTQEQKKPKVPEPAIPHKAITVNPKDTKQQTNKLQVLEKNSERVLLRIHTVFPFVFFPDTIIIDEIKVSLVRMLFFFSYKTQTIPIHTIQDVNITTSIFFATLHILPVGYSATEQWIEIHYLKKNDAELARKIIAGLLVGTRAGVDLTKVETTHIASDLANLGTVN